MHIADGVLGFEATIVVSVISLIAMIKAVKELKNENISIVGVASAMFFYSFVYPYSIWGYANTSYTFRSDWYFDILE